MNKFLPCTLLLVALASLGEGYRILCLYPFNGRSHHMPHNALCKGLARRGHQVDMISHFPTKTPLENYRDVVDLNGTLKSVVNNFSVQYARNLNEDLVYEIATTFGDQMCQLMAQDVMQEFIKNAPKMPQYDLIITEYFGSPCYLGFGAYLKAPVAVTTATVEMPYVDEIIGNPLNYAFFSNMFVDDAVITCFTDRLRNVVANIWNTRRFFHYTGSQTAMMRKYLGQDIPDVRDLEKSISLVLVNTQHSLHGIRPVTPALIMTGGIHIAEDKAQLTKELKAWLDSAKDGVVYFTLGSLINIETLPKEQLLDLYSSFAKIAPVKVLMKSADSTKLPPGLPSNVHTLSWIPQIPVLRHKNIKLFITHGGLQGSLEALNFGIPMIGIPVFGDQIRNVNTFVHKGMAVKMALEEINKDSMDRALDLLLNDPKYMKSAKKESALFRDQPMTQMETAIYWIEYVIRNGPDSLKSPAVDLAWWQLHLLDVYAFLLGCVALIIVVITLSVKVLIRCVCGAKAKGVSNKKKRN